MESILQERFTVRWPVPVKLGDRHQR